MSPGSLRELIALTWSFVVGKGGSILKSLNRIYVHSPPYSPSVVTQILSDGVQLLPSMLWPGAGGHWKDELNPRSDGLHACTELACLATASMCAGTVHLLFSFSMASSKVE